MTTTKKTPIKKAAKAPAKVAAKPAVKIVTPPVFEKPGTPDVIVRRKEMVARIVATSGLKPNAVKTLLDSVLSEMGNALSAGEGLDLHPFGKITVNRQKTVGNKEILVCKLRRKIPQDDDGAVG